LIGNQTNSLEKHEVNLSTQKVYTRNTKAKKERTQKKRNTKTPTKETLNPQRSPKPAK
jgi:hypothetical protein